jgi:phosphoribosylformimino-5-aminoimidazole carboxamide ribotide isomerase
MQIVPVLDLMGGRVVRGVGGRRSEYRPVVSRLASSDASLDVARAFRERFGLIQLYLADLDAIAGGEPALGAYGDLKADGFRLWIDAGVRGFEGVHRLADAGADRIVIGLETVAGPSVLAQACTRFGERIIFSLDLKEGKSLGDPAPWATGDPEEIAARAVASGVRRLIVLDLARVGVGAGTGTEELCARLAAAHPGVEVIAGGGVRGPEDLRRLRGCGVRTALVASALHDGWLTRADWEAL